MEIENGAKLENFIFQTTNLVILEKQLLSFKDRLLKTKLSLENERKNIQEIEKLKPEIETLMKKLEETKLNADIPSDVVNKKETICYGKELRCQKEDVPDFEKELEVLNTCCICSKWIDQLNILVEKIRECFQQMEFPFLVKCSDLCFTIDSDRINMLLQLYKLINLFETKMRCQFADQLKKNEPSLVLWIFVEQLEKRFLFNFYGKKNTNDSTRPEWFINQIFTWIAINDPPINCLTQDLLERENCLPLANFKKDFIEVLIRILREKIEFEFCLRMDIPKLHSSFLLDQYKKLINQEPFEEPNESIRIRESKIFNNPAIFGCYIDELLSLDNKLRQFSYHLDSWRPTLLSFLVQRPVVDKWLELEHALCITKLEQIVSRKDAWDLSRTAKFLPICCEDFMQVVKALENRFKRIPCNSSKQPSESKAKMRFIRLMLELFFDFFEHLSTFFGSNYEPPTMVQVNSQSKDRDRALYVSLNAFHALNSFIVELSNDPCYIQIWEDEAEKKILLSILDELDQLEPTEVDQPEVEAMQEKVSSMAPSLIGIASKVTTVAASTLKSKTLELGSAAVTMVNQKMSGSTDNQNWHLDLGLFKRVHRVYLEQLDFLVEKARSVIIEEFKLHSHEWCRGTDKWQLASNLVQNKAQICLSEEASPALMRLQNWFSSFKKNLHPKLFHRILNLVAEGLNQYLFSQLIMSNKFSQEGANQLRYDIEKCLIPCFNYYYSNIQEGADCMEEWPASKGESHFIDCLDACTLLTLKTAVAMLLQDSLKIVLDFGEQNEHEASLSDPMAPLHDISVYHTLPDAALEILRTRLDLTS